MALYLVLPWVYTADFLRPLLPAPLQVMGAYFANQGKEKPAKERKNAFGSLFRKGKKSSWKAAKKALGMNKGNKEAREVAIPAQNDVTDIDKSGVGSSARRKSSGLAKMAAFDPIRELQRMVEGIEGGETGTDEPLAAKEIARKNQALKVEAEIDAEDGDDEYPLGMDWLTEEDLMDGDAED